MSTRITEIFNSFQDYLNNEQEIREVTRINVLSFSRATLIGYVKVGPLVSLNFCELPVLIPQKNQKCHASVNKIADIKRYVAFFARRISSAILIARACRLVCVYIQKMSLTLPTMLAESHSLRILQIFAKIRKSLC